MLTATDPDTGERYGVDEPELLLWVHCAEIDSYLHVARRSGIPAHRRPGRPLRRRTARAAPAWSASTRPRSPPTPAELAAYFERVRPELAAGPEARDVDDFLRRPADHPPCSSRRANCCGGAWPDSRTPRCPPYAHELYGTTRTRRPQRVTRRLRATGTLLRSIPARAALATAAQVTS